MKIVFTPWYDNNPYQRHLANALEKAGHTIIQYHPQKTLPLVRFVIKNGKPDIFHFHWTHPFFVRKNLRKTVIASILFIIQISTLKLIGVKLIWTVNNIHSHEQFYPRLEKTLNKILIFLFDQIIHLSHASVTIMKNMYTLSNDTIKKFKVVPHGNYVDCYQNSIAKSTARMILEISLDSIVFLCFGSVRPYKGIETLIKAIEKISDERIKLLIAGKPKNSVIENRLHVYCDNDKRIKLFLDFIPDNDIQMYMNAADIIVLPYLDILNSGVAILAMSFGKPVIAPKIGSIPELIDENGGILFEPKNNISLISAIEQSISMDLERMGRYNFEKIKQFSWDFIATITANIYSSK